MKDPTFLQLKKIWYQKLKESGFNDIEDVEKGTLKRFSLELSRHSKNDEHTGREQSRIKYNTRWYDLCRAIQYTKKFNDICDKGFEYASRGKIAGRPKYRKIWALYCEGVHFKEISREVGVSYEGVKSVVRKFKPLVREENDKPDDDEPNSNT